MQYFEIESEDDVEGSRRSLHRISRIACLHHGGVLYFGVSLSIVTF